MNQEQLELDFGTLETFTKDTTVLENLTDMVVKSSSDECNAAITQVYIDSARVEDTKEESLQEEYTPEQILERRQELLQKRKRFVQIVLDAIYDKYKTEIDALIALEPKWQTLVESNFDRVKRWGTARFIKQIVRDDEKLKELLKTKVNIDGSKKAKKQIKDLPYIKSFFARCRVGEDRLLGVHPLKGVESLKGDENGVIAARNFQKIKKALENYRVEVLKEFKIVDDKKITYRVGVNGKQISLKKEIKNPNLRKKIEEASLSISDLESFRVWLKTNLSLEQVSIKNSDENILFCVFVSSLREIVGQEILPARIDTIELYKSLLNRSFISKTLKSSPFKIDALDTTFIETRDSLWKSYLKTPGFFATYPSYYFWFKNALEAKGLKKSHLGQVWGMIPGEFRSDGRNDDKWSKIDLPFNDADKLHKAFEDVRKSWNENAVAKAQFFAKYPSYYFWLKNAPEAEGLNKSHLGHVWGMVPDEFREQWSKINLPFKDADKLHKAFEDVRKSWNGDEDAQAQFFRDYPSYYFWLKDVAEAKGLNESNLGHVWGMIPNEFRSDGRNDDKWSYIGLPFNDADKLYKVFEEVQNSWNGNEEAKEKFFKDYPSYYFWLKNAPEANGLNESHLGHVWGMIPDAFRSDGRNDDKWSYINLPFKDADKLYTAFEGVRKSWNGNDEEKDEFFTKYPSYYFWLKDVAEEEGLNKSHLGHVWGVIPNEFRSDGRNDDKWRYIHLSFEDADKLHNAFERVRNSWNGNEDAKEQFFAKYPSYYFWLKNAPEAEGLNKSHLGHVWGMVPDEFREQWSKINLPFKDADKLHKAFEDVRKSWNGNDEEKDEFFTKYPSYYFWLKDVAEEEGLNKSHLGDVWGMIPGEFRGDGRNDDKWSVIILPFKDADKLYTAFEGVRKSWNGNAEAKKQFFKDYPSYYFWIKNAPEAKGLNKSNLGGVWGMIPDEFRSDGRNDDKWSYINLPFKDADKLYTAFEDVRKSWNGNDEEKDEFFTKYPSYYFWLKDVAEEEGLNKSHLGQVWGMIPGEFRSDGRNDDKWSNICLKFEDADKLHEVFEAVRKSWGGNEEAKKQFFKDYPSYYFWLKNAPEANGLNESHLGGVWGMIPDAFRSDGRNDDKWSNIQLPFKDADKLHAEILDDSKTWNCQDRRAYLQHFSQTNLYFYEYLGLIPASLRQQFNLEYYHPGKIDYNGIKVDSKQEFAVLRVFEEVLGYEPEVGMNFQVKVDSNSRHTFDFKIEYQEEDSHFTHFFEWHPVVVSFNGGRNDATKLEEYEGLLELFDDETYSDNDALIYANSLAEREYYNKRLELLTNNTVNNFRGDVRLTCATAGISGGLKSNLQTLHGFLRQAKPDLDLTLVQLTSMYQGFLVEAMKYEVESA